jgi:hypothetical protein
VRKEEFNEFKLIVTDDILKNKESINVNISKIKNHEDRIQSLEKREFPDLSPLFNDLNNLVNKMKLDFVESL